MRNPQLLEIVVVRMISAQVKNTFVKTAIMKPIEIEMLQEIF